MEQLLEQAKKASGEAEVFRVSSQETQALFEANRLKQVQTRQRAGTALRIIKEGRIGFSATTRADGERELVAMALEMAPFGPQAKFEFPPVSPYPQIAVYDPAVEQVAEEQMVGLGQSLIDSVRKHTPELVCEAGVTRHVSSVEILNSRGGRAGYKKSVFGIAVEGVLIRGTDMLFVGDSDSSCHPISDPRSVVEATLWQLQQARSSARAPAGKLPAIFTPHAVAGALIMPLALAFNGKTVLEGASPLANKKGQKVFDAGLRLWDDATIDYQPGSRFCDDEGVPSQRTPLVENGVVSSFLYDLQTAALAKTRSTGNASRGLGSLPTPSINSVIIGEGEATFEQMVADIKEGLIIEQLIGASQGNILGGEFSGNILLGYRVENGRIVGRVKDTMVSGNVYEVLSDIVAIGAKSRWVGGMLRTPHLYCRSLSVAAKE